MIAPWSPSAAREATRAGLARFLRRKQTPAHRRMVERLRTLLATDKAFEDFGAFFLAVCRWRAVPREMLALVRRDFR